MISDHSVAALVQDVVGAYVGNREPADSVLKITIGGHPRLEHEQQARAHIVTPARYEPLEVKVNFFVEQKPRFGVARDVFVPQLITAPMEEVDYDGAQRDREFCGGGLMVRRWMSQGFATKVAFISTGETLVWLGKMAESYFRCFEGYISWNDQMARMGGVCLTGAHIKITLEDVAGRGIIFHREIFVPGARMIPAGSLSPLSKNVNAEGGEFRAVLALALAQLRAYVRA